MIEYVVRGRGLKSATIRDLMICKCVFRYIADHIKTHDPWLPTRKLPRLLTTSASAIRKIQRMGELQVIRYRTNKIL